MAVKWLASPDAAFSDSTTPVGVIWRIHQGIQISTTVLSSGVKSWNATTVVANNPGLSSFDDVSILADAGRRINFRFKITTLPNQIGRLLLAESSSNNIFNVDVTTAGVLRLTTGTTPTLLKTGSTLVQGTEYRIAVSYVITSTTNWSIKVYLDGNLNISATNADGTLNATGTNSLDIGLFGYAANVTIGAVLLAHVYVDDSTALTDPGDIRVTAKRPNANGTLNEFTTQIGVSGSGYGTGHSPQVNERPATTTNGWSRSNTTIKTEEYAIEGIAVGDIDLTGTGITLVDWMGWIFSDVDSISNGPVHHIITEGTATLITESVTARPFFHVKGSTTYPSGNAVIGMDAKFNSAHLTSLYECGIVVAYLVPLVLTLTANQGSFTETGEASVPIPTMPSNQGSFTETGEAIVPVVVLPVAKGSFSESIEFVDFLPAPQTLLIHPDAGSFSETGEPVDTPIILPLGMGSFIETSLKIVSA